MHVPVFFECCAVGVSITWKRLKFHIMWLKFDPLISGHCNLYSDYMAIFLKSRESNNNGYVITYI